MTTQLAFSHCPFTELHSAPNDGKDANYPTQTRAPLQGRRGWQSPPEGPAASLFSMLFLGRGRGGNTTGFFSSANVSSTSLSGEIPGPFLLSRQEEEFSYRQNRTRKGLGQHKPPVCAGVAGGGGLGAATSWKAGREMKSPVSRCSYCRHGL